MINFFDWVNNQKLNTGQPWLVIGKGPSFSKFSQLDLSQYVTIGLNDVAREVKVDIVHLLDLSVIDRLENKLLSNAEYLLIPWVPHIDYRLPLLDKVFHKASDQNLEQYVQEHPLLSELDRENRLLWYDASSAGANVGPGKHPQIRVGTFSAAAAINLLATAGIKTIKTLGVDGGRAYSKSFSDLEGVSLLDAGQETYNLQFVDMAQTIRETNVDLAPVDVESPVKVFVGTQPEQMLATKVLEYSIRKHASMSVEVIPLYKAIEDAGINNRSVAGKTPFSFQRFAIPKLKNFKGKAIYVDSDMQVFSDIRELWTWPIDDDQILTVHKRSDDRIEPQFSVMVLNCEQLDWNVDDICMRIEDKQHTYEDIVYRMSHVDRINYSLPTRWNDLENYEEGRTSLIHYTDMIIQPWVSVNNKFARVWCEELMEAIKEKFIHIDEINEQIDKGWIRPSLRYQVENNIADPQLIPSRILKKLDRDYVPSFHLTASLKRLSENRSDLSILNRAKLWAVARLYHIWVTSNAQLFSRKIRKTFKKIKIALS